MIMSTLLTIAPSIAADEETPTFCVEKQVYNGEGWSDLVHAVYGDIVQFKITMTYYGEYCVESIVATDNLPPCLEYVQTLEPEDIEPITNGNVIAWDLGETYLEPYCSTDIIFEAKVIGIGENVNSVNVTAKECCPTHDVYAVDTATVIVDPSVDVEKRVWDSDSEAWVDELDGVIKNRNVRFQITSTYHGNISMKCMLVKDCLPMCCFEYANKVSINIAGEEISENDARYPDITADDEIWFDWRNAEFYLQDGETVVIEFNAKVINYCEETVTNWAWVFLWGCYTCDPDNYVFNWDSAIIHCYPHDPIFQKTVWDGQQWTEKANVYVNDIIKYKIDLIYYGIDNLTDIKIMDELPCVLEHVDENATLGVLHNNTGQGQISSIETKISGDKKTAWWNLTDELEDSGMLSIVFNVLVTGETGDCEECGINTASYTAYSMGYDYSGSDTAKIYSTDRPPVPPTKISIKLKRIGIGRICGTINNIGDGDLSNVKCTISVKAGILKRIKLDVTETFEEIKAGGSASVCTGKRSIKLAFGRIAGKITVVVGDETFEKNFKGFVIGRLIIVRQPMIQPMS